MKATVSCEYLTNSPLLDFQQKLAFDLIPYFHAIAWNVPEVNFCP